MTEQHRNIYMALAAAQTDMGGVKKGSVNPAFKSKYADLADVVAAVSPALNAQGIAFFATGVVIDGERYMRTVLAHGASDTQIACDVPLIVNKNDMQGFKSATTYAKRIGLESLTGVAPIDDDGNAASKAAPVTARKVGRAEMETLDDLLDRTETPRERFFAYAKVDGMADITIDQYDSLVKMLGRKLAEVKA
jgi:hypothetical protein